ncbi:MAG: hypothetical protein HY474_01595 [Candidatus Sungbacteria bacterium]|uniref:Uncharacterized protein n=1 Tax=Candidatus Sungiibacteriota bacterium TaxID=2750080 RepID=A0A932YWQ3_9BACT|nr:hypothetical protein [Candidatus Sungbacteria bacterium]
MRTRDYERERNELATPILVFLESYNQKLPAGFPRASVAALKQFQTAYPTLFKHGDAWSIDKHRKRLMDWLASHRDQP